MGTAPPPRTSTASMMSTLPRETPWALLATRSLPTPPHLLKLPMLVTLPPPSTKVLDVELDVRDLPGGQAGGRVASKHQATILLTSISRLCISSQCNVPFCAIYI